MNKLHRIILITSVIIGIFYSLFSCTESPANISEEQWNKEKLDSLAKICSSSVFGKEGISNARKLKNIAEQLNEDHYIALAYRYMLLTNMNLEQKDSIPYFAQQAKYYFNKEGAKNDASRIDLVLIQWTMQYESADIALEKTKSLLEDVQSNHDKYQEFEVYELLSNIYMILERPAEASATFQKMMDIRPEINSRIESSLPFIFSSGSQIADAEGKYEEALSYCDSAEFYINKNPQNRSYQILPTLLDLNRATSLIKLKRWKEAKQILDILSAQHTSDKAEKYYYYIQSLYADYYLYTREYNKALEAIDRAIKRFSEIGDNINYISATTKKIDIYSAKNDFENAILLKNSITHFSDSLEKANTSKQINELRTTYHVSKLENQIEKEKLKLQNTRILIIFLVVICILLFIVVAIVKRNLNILKKKNGKLFEQYNEMDKYKNQISSLLSSKSNNVEIPEEKSLYDKMVIHLQNTLCFLEPDLSREKLALELGTNRQYLTQAIQESKKMTFMEYINDLRLEYARHLLCNQPELSIEVVYIDSGFLNKSTFYRLFKQKYNLTPKEMRDLSIENTKN
ncbi:MAG: helix-turn-helix domain-containing protein [Dysgonomonas sp.]